MGSFFVLFILCVTREWVHPVPCRTWQLSTTSPVVLPFAAFLFTCRRTGRGAQRSGCSLLRPVFVFGKMCPVSYLKSTPGKPEGSFLEWCKKPCDMGCGMAFKIKEAPFSSPMAVRDVEKIPLFIFNKS